MTAITTAHSGMFTSASVEQGGSYRVILADPPWRYSNHREQGSGNGCAAAHYDTMDAVAIAAVPIRDLAARDAALFLWATWPCLPEALDVMRAWGFRYTTCAFAWVKTNPKSGGAHIGLGHYTRGNSEPCLLGIRGKMTVADHAVSQVLISPRRQHSRKPDQQYGLIDRLYPKRVDGERLEVFARQTWPGWHQYGDQTNLFPAQPFLLEPAS